MAPPKRKVPFDPQSVKDNVKRRKLDSEVVQYLEETAVIFSKHVFQLSEEFEIDENKSNLMKELWLVTRIGLNGIITLKDACNAVPDNFPHQLSIITSLINRVLSNPVTEIQCSALLNALRKTSSLKDHVASSSDGSLLWSTALASGKPVKFLTPPVSTCRNVACKLFNMDSSCTPWSNSSYYVYTRWSSTCPESVPQMQELWVDLWVLNVWKETTWWHELLRLWKNPHRGHRHHILWQKIAWIILLSQVICLTMTVRVYSTLNYMYILCACMCAYTVFTVGLCSLDLPKPISNTVTTVNMMLELFSQWYVYQMG